MTCTFFGHRNCPNEIRSELYIAISKLIEKQNVDTFLVGNEGAFDRMVQGVLFEIKQKYPNITCLTVKAYYDPCNSDEDILESIYPECVACSPKRFAIDRRNRYMIERCDIVLVYVNVSFGGAAKFTEIAKRKNKFVINLVLSDNPS